MAATVDITKVKLAPWSIVLLFVAAVVLFLVIRGAKAAENYIANKANTVKNSAMGAAGQPVQEEFYAEA